MKIVGSFWCLFVQELVNREATVVKLQQEQDEIKRELQVKEQELALREFDLVKREILLLNPVEVNCLLNLLVVTNCPFADLPTQKEETEGKEESYS